eukprot:CAMPEP_0179888808 /NCGR_PEP_ID=MMETSP0982-20121206/32178_1 /TAXON_ID=483367 /ORGANISM="non described non described, Strain CCMP 2436" /LENGTH=143 /DNA_ID=CAMNT_0021784813 /DNA_START=271 /DNA_END=699 /DNA_ORIENTATION=+
MFAICLVASEPVLLGGAAAFTAASVIASPPSPPSDTCTDAELIAGGKNPLFRRFSITYQHKETCVTLIVKDTLTKNGMATRVLCHDGLIADGGLDRLGRPIDRGIGEVHTLLRICEQAVKEQMGYCAQLELKPLTPKSGGSFE